MVMYDPLGLTWPGILTLEAAMAARSHVNQRSGAPDQSLCRKSLPWNLCSGILQSDVSAEANLHGAYSGAIQDSELRSWILDHHLSCH